MLACHHICFCLQPLCSCIKVTSLLCSLLSLSLCLYLQQRLGSCQSNQASRTSHLDSRNQPEPHLCSSMRMGFGCEIVSVDEELRLCLSMSLRLRFVFLSLRNYSARRLLICSTLDRVRKAAAACLRPSGPYSHTNPLQVSTMTKSDIKIVFHAHSTAH